MARHLRCRTDIDGDNMGLLDLPHAILIHIMSHLLDSAEDLRTVSKAFLNLMVSAEVVTKTPRAYTIRVTSKDEQDATLWSPLRLQIRSGYRILKLEGDWTPTMGKLLATTPNLEELNVTDDFLSPAYLDTTILASLPKLKAVSLRSWDQLYLPDGVEGSHGLQDTLFHSTPVDAINNEFAHLPSRLQALSICTLIPGHLPGFSGALQRLDELTMLRLTLSGRGALSPEGMVLLANCLRPGLEELDLHITISLEDAAFNKDTLFFQSLQRMEALCRLRLNFSGDAFPALCTSLTMLPPALRSLSIGHENHNHVDFGSTDAIILQLSTVLPAFPLLESLELGFKPYCLMRCRLPALTALSGSMQHTPGLQRLTLSLSLGWIDSEAALMFAERVPASLRVFELSFTTISRDALTTLLCGLKTLEELKLHVCVMAEEEGYADAPLRDSFNVSTLGCLKVLELCGYPTTDMLQVLAKLPRSLEVLKVISRPFKASPAHLPRLMGLNVYCPSLRELSMTGWNTPKDESLTKILANLPEAIEHVSLSNNSISAGLDKQADLIPLSAAHKLRCLHLDPMRGPIGGLLPNIPTSLVTLSISCDELEKTDRDALAMQLELMPKLKHLTCFDCGLSDAVVGRLRELHLIGWE